MVGRRAADGNARADTPIGKAGVRYRRAPVVEPGGANLGDVIYHLAEIPQQGVCPQPDLFGMVDDIW